MRFSDYSAKIQDEGSEEDETTLINGNHDPIKDKRLPKKQRTIEWIKDQTQALRKELANRRKQRDRK